MISSSAHVHPSAWLGRGTQIGPGSSIDATTEIGDDAGIAQRERRRGHEAIHGHPFSP